MPEQTYWYRAVVGADRLFRAEASSTASLPGFWSGWLAPTADARDPLDLSEIWDQAAGTLLFLADQPSDLGVFQTELMALLSSIPGEFKPRLLWLRNPNAPAAQWDYDRVAIAGRGAQSRVANPHSFRFADYSLRLDAGTALTLDTDAPVAQFSFGEGFELLSPQSRARPSAVTLPMAGADFGVWLGELALTGTTPADTLQALGVMLRYAQLEPRSDRTQSVDMPILTQQSSLVSLAMGLDPLAPLVPQRTRLRFQGSATSASKPLLSGWLTTLGRRIELTPISDPPELLEPAGLVFASTPRRLSDAAAGTRFHLAPNGAFALSSSATQTQLAQLPIDTDGNQERLMLGLAGTEYLGLAAQSQPLAVFFPNRPALLLQDNDPEDGPLNPAATTAYASFVDVAVSNGMPYYAQPQAAPLYAAGDSATVLDFHPVLSGRLAPLSAVQASGAEALSVLPVGAYLGLDSRRVGRAAEIENAGLAPARRRAMGVPTMAAATSAPPVRAVTPPGLVAEVDDTRYDKVVIGNLPESQTAEIAFDRVSDRFQAALQSNQLFFVVADPAALGEQNALDLEMSGWRFKLGPESWRSDPNSRTYLLFKFAGRTLQSLAAEPASWGWQQAGRTPGGTLQDTSDALATLFAAAQAAPEGSPQQRFYRDVVANSAWSGVLFLNAAIDVGQLDPQLGFITAGVVLDRFYAQHVGFSLTPYTLDPNSKQIVLGQTAAFALVDYQDRRDLSTTKTIPFAYKTLALTARFANAALVGFSAEVELLTNQLFATQLTKVQPERGNNLVLAGSFHTVDGAPAYAFDLVGRNVYRTDSGALAEIEVLSVGLQTEQVDADTDALITRFALNGNLRFQQVVEFDAFAFGADADGTGPGSLRYSNLSVRMHSRRSGEGEVSFVAVESGLAFDIANSTPRPQSLIAKFPLTLTSFAAVAPADQAPTPDKLGYASIATPIDQSVLEAPWFGLVYTLQLGTLGNLAGSAGLSVEMLTAWAPAGENGDAGIYVGLKLPGAGGDIQWPLQGVLSLGFRSFEMQRYAVDPEQAGAVDDGSPIYGYLLRLRRFALSFLGFSVPPGNTDVVLFGNPQTGAKGPLGWYAAYAKELPPKTPPSRQTQALRAGPSRDVARLRRERGGRHN